MADKAISALTAATNVGNTDLFVLEQGNTAKKLTGQVLLNYLTAAADGHGGINTIAKTGTSGLVDTYTITFADTSTWQFRVTNGAKGDQGEQTYVYIKYASQEPTVTNPSFGDVPDDWMGICSTTDAESPTDFQRYTWVNIKGATGQQGIQGIPGETYTTVVNYGASGSTTEYPANWYTSITSVPLSAGSFQWTRAQYVDANNNVVATAYSVSHIGRDGTGAGSVNSVTFGGTTYYDTAGDVSIPMPSSGDIGAIAEPASKGDGQFLQWDSGANEWVAATPTGSVTTVNGRGVTAGTTNIQLTQNDIGTISNENIFDNPYLVINQRGFTSGSVTNTTFVADRWQPQNGATYLTVTRKANGGISVKNNASGTGVSIAQKIESDRLTDGVYTISMLGTFSNNFSFRIYDETSSAFLHNGDQFLAKTGLNYETFSLSGVTPGHVLRVLFYTWNGDFVLDAAKLERGSVSTLLNDVPPNYATELLKCQRYCQIRSTNNIADADLRPNMRTSPSKSAVTGGYAYIADL